MRFKNKVHILKTIAKARLGGKFPLFISWSLTDRCNYKCKYCDIWQRRTEELTTNQICSIIDILSNNGMEAVSFIGGEPLLRGDIGKIIDYTHSKRVYIKITTNGKLIPNKINEIKNVDLIKITLNGPKEMHDWQRQEGSYEDVISAVQILKHNGLKVRLNFVISKENLNCIDFILEFVERFDIKVTFQLLEHRSETNMLLHLPSESELKNIFKKLIHQKRGGNRYIGNSLDYLEYVYNYYPNYCQGRLRCEAGRLHWRITTRGEFVACDRIRNKTSLDCLKPGFKEALRGLQNISCQYGCWRNSTIELNYLLSLKLGTILNIKDEI